MQKKRTRKRAAAKPTYTEKWGEGKFLVFRMSAQQIALGAESAIGAVEMARTGIKPDGSPFVPNLENWVSLYEKPASLAGWVVDNLSLGSGAISKGTADETTRMVLNLFKPPAMSADATDDRAPFGTTAKSFARNAAGFEKALFKEHVKRLRKEIKNPGRLPRTMAALSETAEFWFFIGVTVPCWIEFGQFPHALYRQATAGEFKALERLLWVDQFALESAKIRTEFYKVMRGKNRRRKNLLKLAIAKEGKPKQSRRRIKVLHAALIDQLFKRFEKSIDDIVNVIAANSQNPLDQVEKRKLTQMLKTNLTSGEVVITTPEIRQLFNAVAGDLEGTPYDKDLPAQDGTLYQAIYRDRAFWSPFFQVVHSDIFPLSGVRVSP